MKWNVSALQKSTGVPISQPELFEEAFTHSSFTNESKKKHKRNNERLEFLGDAVLELAVSDYLFRRFHDAAEGEMTKLRASIVCEPTLAKIAEQLQFGEFALLGRGEARSGGRRRPALLADLFESFVGALYLDAGMANVQSFLERHLFADLNSTQRPIIRDYKSKLQEYVQNVTAGQVVYEIESEEGPAHDRLFRISVKVNDKPLGRGTGRSKKEAEQAAASQALLALKVDFD